MSPHQWAPSASWKNLCLRADLFKRTRAFFDERDFLEVDTPVLSADTVVDRHLEPIAVVVPDDTRQPNVGRRMWLQTSPEFSMKRLLAAGGEDAPGAIYQITHAFRAGESGQLHNPEFTMVEWYRVGDGMEQGMNLLSELANVLLQCGPAQKISYREAFLKFAEFDPFTTETGQFAALAAANGLAVPPALGDDRDQWLDLLLAELVAPKLGGERPTIINDYPASQAALANVRHEEPPVAERFELFVNGIELANGYHELTDPDESCRRFTEANEQRRADGKSRLPEQSQLLDALKHGLPDCTGVALGLDRIVMLAASANSLADVIPFTIDRA